MAALTWPASVAELEFVRQHLAATFCMMDFRLDPDCEAIFAVEDGRQPELSDTFTRADFDREYVSVREVVLRELSRVGSVSPSIGGGDFVMVASGEPPRRVIILVAASPEVASPAYIPAAHAALQLLPAEYSIRFENEPAYVCVCRDGTVLGYYVGRSPEPLAAWGFPPDAA